MAQQNQNDLVRFFEWCATHTEQQTPQKQQQQFHFPLNIIILCIVCERSSIMWTDRMHINEKLLYYYMYFGVATYTVRFVSVNLIESLFELLPNIRWHWHMKSEYMAVCCCCFFVWTTESPKNVARNSTWKKKLWSYPWLSIFPNAINCLEICVCFSIGSVVGKILF